MSWPKRTLILSFSLLVAVLLFAFSRKTKEAACLLLTDATAFDSETGTYRAPQDILLRDGLITSLTPGGTFVPGSEACERVSLAQKFLFPGFIDAHTHLLAYDSQRVHDWKTAMELSAARPGMTRLFMAEKNAESLLRAGFTAVRDLGNSGNFLDENLRQRIETQKLNAPDLLISGPGLALAPSQIDLRLNPAEYTLVSPETDLGALFALYERHRVDWIKVYADNSRPEQKMDAAAIRRIISAAKARGFKVAVHAEYPESVALALNSGADSIEHFSAIPPADSGARPYAVLTDYSYQTCRQRRMLTDCTHELERLRERAAWLRQNNFKIVFGSDSILDFTSDFKSRGEAALASLASWGELGFTPAAALTAATATAAEMLGLDAGQIKPGFKADFVAFDADPLADFAVLTNPALVIKGGRLICRGCRP